MKTKKSEFRSGLLVTGASQAQHPMKTKKSEFRSGLLVTGASQAQHPMKTKRPELRSGLLRLPEDLGDLVDLGQQLVGDVGVHRALGAGGTRELGGLVDERVQLRVLLEVRGLEVVGPQHPEVVLDQLGALLLDDHRAGAEVGVVVVGQLADDGLDRLGLDAGLSGVVDAAGQVAVGVHVESAGEDPREHSGSLRSGDSDRSVLATLLPWATARYARPKALRAPPPVGRWPWSSWVWSGSTAARWSPRWWP